MIRREGPDLAYDTDLDQLALWLYVADDSPRARRAQGSVAFVDRRRRRPLDPDDAEWAVVTLYASAPSFAARAHLSARQPVGVA